jgi:hypothetical protein
VTAFALTAEQQDFAEREELIIMPGGHFDAYTVGFEASSGLARDWFARHLGG